MRNLTTKMHKLNVRIHCPACNRRTHIAYASYERCLLVCGCILDGIKAREIVSYDIGFREGFYHGQRLVHLLAEQKNEKCQCLQCNGELKNAEFEER